MVLAPEGGREEIMGYETLEREQRRIRETMEMEEKIRREREMKRLKSDIQPKKHEQEAKSREPAIRERGGGLKSQGKQSKFKSPREQEDEEIREMASEEAIKKKKAMEEYKRIREEIELKARNEKEEADRLFKENLLAVGCSDEYVESVLKDNNPGIEDETLQEKEKEDTLFEERMKTGFLEARHTAESVGQFLKDGKERRNVEEPIDLTRPKYIKVNRKYILPETLDEYGLPWEWDEVSLITAINGLSNSCIRGIQNTLLSSVGFPGTNKMNSLHTLELSKRGHLSHLNQAKRRIGRSCTLSGRKHRAEEARGLRRTGEIPLLLIGVGTASSGWCLLAPWAIANVCFAVRLALNLTGA
jgi:hypothetical protein